MKKMFFASFVAILLSSFSSYSQTSDFSGGAIEDPMQDSTSGPTVCSYTTTGVPNYCPSPNEVDRPGVISVTQPWPVGATYYGGEAIFETSMDWIVPNGVNTLRMVGVGAGGGAKMYNFPAGSGPQGNIERNLYGGGGGGALCWVNNVAVNAGDTITIHVGVSASPTTYLNGDSVQAENGGDTWVEYQGKIIFTSGGGGGSVNRNGGSGGVPGGHDAAYSPTCFSGGSGSIAINGYSQFVIGGGGGAAGYAGDGGNACSTSSPSGCSANPSSTSGAASGSANYFDYSYTSSCTGGGGVGLLGIGPSGSSSCSGGSVGASGDVIGNGGNFGGGNGSGNGVSGQGGVRLIWGNGVSYPSNATF